MSTSFRAEEVRALRLASSEAYGDAYFDDPAVQQSLLFEKRGDVIFDKAGDLNLEYRYPSAIGSAVFFHGAFEGGEIAFASAVLRQCTDPVVIDAGANIGLHIVSWAEAVPSLRGFAFEPVARNRELLEANLRRHELLDRVRIESVALGKSTGSILFHETDDAAYSSALENGRRGIVAKYEVPVTTIDEYVLAAGIGQVDLIKIDVEGYEDAVLAGAQRTIAARQPYLFVEICAENHNADPDATIASLVAVGYCPYVINDGVVTQFERHDDRFYNYFFVHKNRPVVLPPPDLREVRRSLGLHMDTIRRQSRRLGQSRSEPVTPLSEALAAAGEAKTLREHLRRKEDVIQGLKATVDEQREHIQRFQKAANERLDVIKRFDAHVAYLREQLEYLSTRAEAEQKAAQERGKRILELTQSLDERNRQLEELRASFESTKMDATAKDLLIGKLDEFLRSQRDEAEQMRKVAQERLAVIEQLDELARERLEVIRSLNERMHAG